MGKKNKSGVGHGILKARTRGFQQHGEESWRHTSEIDDAEDLRRLNISSITEQSALDDFLATAELAGTEFTAEKLNVSVVTPSINDGILTAEKARHIKQAQEEHKTLLRIPRRPSWTTSMDAQELDLKERDSFIDWRRELASLQDKEHIILTPFEKNLEFWRQLWRVIERSDVIVQIVDARNPLLFRCEDLELYVKEVSPHKENLLLVNKADYLTESQRLMWASYFQAKGICVAFWSALAETERLLNEKEAEAEEDEKEAEQPSRESDEDDDDDGDVDDKMAVASRFSKLSTEDQEESDAQQNEQKDTTHGNTDVEQVETSETNENPAATHKLTKQKPSIDCEQNTSTKLGQDTQSDKTTLGANVDDQIKEMLHKDDCKCVRSKQDKISLMDFSGKMLTSDEFIELCQELHYQSMDQEGSEEEKRANPTTIGMVGYPNVGKSSSINAIIQHKQLAVSATPGKTKHFQTLHLSKDVCLCDCPGLVFPSFVSTKAEMVVNGILPIDQMRDHVPPVTLVCQRIPRLVLEAVYGINIAVPEEGEDPDRPPYAEELLSAYGCMRGYMTSRGTADCPRSSRYILKEYVQGKLLYCTPPPGVDSIQFQNRRYTTGKFAYLAETLERKSIELASKTGARPKTSSIDAEFFVKKEVRQYSKGIPVMVPGQMGVAQVTEDGMVYKPWKKHNNKNKREKLRRLVEN